MRGEKCKDDDFERWYARAGDHECIMGHKVRRYFVYQVFALQYYWPRSNGTKDGSRVAIVMLERNLTTPLGTKRTVHVPTWIMNG